MAPLEQLVENILQAEDRCEKEPQIPPAQVMEPSMVADMGTFGHTYVRSYAMLAKNGKMADSGANCCMTNN